MKLSLMKADSVISQSLNSMLKLRICKAILREGVDGPLDDLYQVIRMG
jgi:hypothetical protein